MKYTVTLSLLLISFLLRTQTYYVNQNAAGDNDGSSWENAWTDLSTALNFVSQGDVWIAEGTYYPTEDVNREATFELPVNVNLYGGFPAVGSPTWEERDWLSFSTVFSGDIGVENDTSDNSFHILTLSSWDPFDNVIDGFVFTAANSDYAAGGISVSGLFDLDSKLVVRNCVFRENYADYEGAAISTNWMNIIVSNCVFEDNFAGYEGAAISASRSNLLVEDCLFKNNYAEYEGGAISYTEGFSPSDDYSLVVKNSVFQNNFAVYGGGAVETVGDSRWYNCLFEENRAENEGGVFSHFSYGWVDMVNCTFVRNVSDGEGSVFDAFSWGSEVPIGAEFVNCVFSENEGVSLLQKSGAVDSIVVRYSLLGNCPTTVECNGGNILSDVPGFVGGNNFRLTPESSAVDAGDNTVIPNDLLTDLDDNARIIGEYVDMGAYELSSTVSTQWEHDKIQVLVFPNPARNHLFIKTENFVLLEVSLYNSNGREIFRQDTGDDREAIVDLTGFTSGVYTVHVKSDKQSYWQKVIVL